MAHALKATKQIFHFLAYGHILFMWLQACVRCTGGSDQNFCVLKLSCSTVALFPISNSKLLSCPEVPVAFLWVSPWRLDIDNKEYSESACLKGERCIFSISSEVFGGNSVRAVCFLYSRDVACKKIMIWLILGIYPKDLRNLPLSWKLKSFIS